MMSFFNMSTILSDMCRLCLERIGTRNIFGERKLLNDIAECSGILVKHNIALPQMACEVCLERLRVCKSFRQLLAQTDKRLHALKIPGNNADSEKECPRFVSRSTQYLEEDIPSSLTYELGQKCTPIVSKGFQCSKEDLFSDSTCNLKPKCTSVASEPTQYSEEYTPNDATYSLLRQISARKFNLEDEDVPSNGTYHLRQKSIQRYPSEEERSDSLESETRDHTYEKSVKITGSDSEEEESDYWKPKRRDRTNKKRSRCYEDDKVKLKKLCKVEKNEIITEKDLTCEQCGKVCSNPKALYCHRRYHVKNFICHICTKSFSIKNDLVKHIRVHTGEKPYACTECGRQFAQIVTLRLHKCRYRQDSLAGKIKIPTINAQDWKPYCNVKSNKRKFGSIVSENSSDGNNDIDESNKVRFSSKIKKIQNERKDTRATEKMDVNLEKDSAEENLTVLIYSDSIQSQQLMLCDNITMNEQNCDANNIDNVDSIDTNRTINVDANENLLKENAAVLENSSKLTVNLEKEIGDHEKSNQNYLNEALSNDHSNNTEVAICENSLLSTLKIENECTSFISSPVNLIEANENLRCEETITLRIHSKEKCNENGIDSGNNMETMKNVDFDTNLERQHFAKLKNFSRLSPENRNEKIVHENSNQNKCSHYLSPEHIKIEEIDICDKNSLPETENENVADETSSTASSKEVEVNQVERFERTSIDSIDGKNQTMKKEICNDTTSDDSSSKKKKKTKKKKKFTCNICERTFDSLEESMLHKNRHKNILRFC